MAMRRRFRVGDNLVRDDRTGFKLFASEVERDHYGSLVKKGTGDGEHPLEMYDILLQYTIVEEVPRIINNYDTFIDSFPPPDFLTVNLIANNFYDLGLLSDCQTGAYDFGETVPAYENTFDYGSISEESDTIYYYQNILNTSQRTEDYGSI